MNQLSPLISCQDLALIADQPEVVILDASVKKIVGKKAIEYDQFECIPNSVHIDLDKDFHAIGATQPHTMPDAKQFEEQAQKLGINADSKVVIYDNQGIYSAPRAWWMFKVMGFEQVYVLDGGLPKWKEANLPMATDYISSPPGELLSSKQPDKVVSVKDVLARIDHAQHLIVDVRGAGRFHGTAPEPRPGLRSGHIPSSVNLPFANVLTDDGLCFKSTEELKSLFANVGLTSVTQNATFSCGSGMTACIVMLAAFSCGFIELSLYDGSWSEWGADHNLPIEV